MTQDTPIKMFFNPHCSNCKRAREILSERGADVELIFYLDQGPDRAELERILNLLHADDPRVMMRSKEPLYQELALENADRETLLDAMVQHPILIQRPIVIYGTRAVIGRPPERVLEVLDERGH